MHHSHFHAFKTRAHKCDLGYLGFRGKSDNGTNCFAKKCSAWMILSHENHKNGTDLPGEANPEEE